MYLITTFEESVAEDLSLKYARACSTLWIQLYTILIQRFANRPAYRTP